MPELGLYGSVRGARGDSRPYRKRLSAVEGLKLVTRATEHYVIAIILVILFTLFRFNGAQPGCKSNRRGRTMRSVHPFLHLGLVAAAALAVSSASAAPRILGRPERAGPLSRAMMRPGNFTAVRRHRAWTYQVTDKTRFVVSAGQKFSCPRQLFHLKARG